MSPLWDTGLEDVDPFVAELVRLEEARQRNKVILVPSETICPKAVREALASPFTSIYAEGYPQLLMEGATESELQDLERQILSYRRYGNRRFYKGTEYADVIEELARERVKTLFATQECPPEKIFANVQPLSGAAANNAVYHALLQPGDVLMGMALTHGGHLTHGSDLNRSGRLYKGISYFADEVTGELDYDALRKLAREHRPRLIVAGFTSYPWAPDWRRLREIADEVGAYLLADIAHPAGLVVAGLYPNPVGIAHVVTFTTHKTLCGPRAAVILTTDPQLAQAIDSAVFPGEQGGPHVNKIAAMAVAFRLATKEEFRKLQRGIVENARHLCRALMERGVNICYGGTDTHLLVVSLKNMGRPTGYPLMGEIGARILDLAGIVVNKNTVPSDASFSTATGIRLGTPWVTQRGMGPAEMEELADIICVLLRNIRPFTYMGSWGPLPRGKVPSRVLEEARERVRSLIQKSDGGGLWWGYPHAPGTSVGEAAHGGVIRVSGDKSWAFLQEVCTKDLSCMGKGDSREALLLDEKGRIIDKIRILREGRNSFLVRCTKEKLLGIATWFRNLSDGYVIFDEEDILRKVQGPVRVSIVLETEAQGALGGPLEEYSEGLEGETLLSSMGHLVDLDKPYFIGMGSLWKTRGEEADAWTWMSPEENLKGLRRTPLYPFHSKHARKLGAFAGWEMPIWFTSIQEEHRAVRTGAGLFDASHMGTIGISGEDCLHFLDLISSNYVRWLKVGEGHYTFILDPKGTVLDDSILYRIGELEFLMVVNAANSTKVLRWLEAVARGEAILDGEGRKVTFRGNVQVSDLNGEMPDENSLVDLPLQGPRSREILERLSRSLSDKWTLRSLKKGQVARVGLGPTTVWVARTGYTGEPWGFELFVNPQKALDLWEDILKVGEPMGCMPAGLGARDSLRIEAGLPLFGAELQGPYRIDPIEAGFGNYVKLHKPFFCGRMAMVARSRSTTRRIVRFRLEEKGAKLIRQGALVIHRRTQQLMGRVTSAAPNGEGIQVGLALVEKRFARAGTPIALLPHEGEAHSGPVAMGQRIILPEAGVILTRFPGRDLWD